MVTPREQFAAAIRKAMGQPGLTKAQRLNEVIRARRCRNIFWNAIAPIAFDVPFFPPTPPTLQAITRQFGFPIIVTDILNYSEANIIQTGATFIGISYELRVFLAGLGNKEDFFGCADAPLASFLTLNHEQNANPNNDIAGADALDWPSVKINFAPFLQRVGQTFEFNWFLIGALDTAPETQINCEADFRGITVLPTSDPYACLHDRAKSAVCSYIDSQEPETFLLNVRVPVADFPAPGESIALVTEPQDRPLLILGAGSNIDGAQLELRDLGCQWDFTVKPQPSPLAFDGVTGTFVNAISPPLNGVPLYLVAPDTRMTNRDAYNLFSVPHFLEPLTSLQIRLTNGLHPNGNAATYQQVMETNGAMGRVFEEGPGHITFLCRTV